MKVFFRTIHLYLSLAAGIVIAIVCFTGATLVFEKEMQMSIYPERYHVKVEEEQTSIDQMVKQVEKKVPGAQISSVKVYSDPSRTVEISYKEEKEKTKGDKAKSLSSTQNDKHGKEGKNGHNQKNIKEGSEKKGGRENMSIAFMNPYTGKLITMYHHRKSFFFTMFALHRWLLVEGPGKIIVGISTSIFLFILLTGIILWWPKNKQILKQRLSLKWTSGWKRVNHDLHIVVGFYTAIFLFAFAFTGLAWSFKWFNEGIYWVTNSESKPPEPPGSVFQEGKSAVSLDLILLKAKDWMPDAQYYTINTPRDSAASFSVIGMPEDPIHERASNQLYLDQYSGNKLGQLLYSDRNLGQQVRSIFYTIHVGSIGGLPGRIIALISCIAGITFPITGVILWINRLRKKKKKKAKKLLKSGKEKLIKELI